MAVSGWDMAVPPRTGKTTWRNEHQRLVAAMKAARLKAGLSQAEVARRLNREQTYVSKLERGVQGLEVIEFLDYCASISADAGRMLNSVSEDRLSE